MGCWNVGVYMVSDQAEAAAQGQAQFKALVSGEKSTSNPSGAMTWSRCGMVRFKPRWIHFTTRPCACSLLRQMKGCSHPCGEAFENLTTPLNTEELSLLANLPLREMPGIPLQDGTFSLNPPRTDNPFSALKSAVFLRAERRSVIWITRLISTP